MALSQVFGRKAEGENDQPKARPVVARTDPDGNWVTDDRGYVIFDELPEQQRPNPVARAILETGRTLANLLFL